MISKKEAMELWRTWVNGTGTPQFWNELTNEWEDFPFSEVPHEDMSNVLPDQWRIKPMVYEVHYRVAIIMWNGKPTVEVNPPRFYEQTENSSLFIRWESENVTHQEARQKQR